MLQLPKLSHLPSLLNKGKLPFKIVLGILVITFFLDYQPTLAFPPIKQSVAHAQEEQTASVSAQEIPVTFTMPHPIQMISTYYSWWHPGVDLAAPLGTPIHPVAEGEVEQVGFDIWGLGNNVVVDHPGGYQSTYAHMGRMFVKKGDKVTPDTILGEVGLTGHTSGPHTHLQISKDGKTIDPLTVLPKI